MQMAGQSFRTGNHHLGRLYAGAFNNNINDPPVGAPAHKFSLQQPPVRHRASPQQSASPHAPPAVHQLNQSNSSSSSSSSSISTKYPMAPPQTPGTPKSPQSPGDTAREQHRINLLLEINIELLQEVNRLQNEGKGGAMNPQQAMQMQREGKSDAMASDEYIACLRRVQANLSYLMPKASADHVQQVKAPPGPAHMTAPTHMPQLQQQYAKLRELFPSWQGLDQRQSGSAPSSSSPRPNAPNGMTGPSASTSTQN